MTVHINGSKGKELYYNGTKIKEAYYGSIKVYSGGPLYYCYKYNNSNVYAYTKLEITDVGTYTFYGTQNLGKATNSSQLVDSTQNNVVSVSGDSITIRTSRDFVYIRQPQDDLYT